MQYRHTPPPLDLLRQHSPWIVSFSGGKDSTATLLWALGHNPEDTLAIFCDTGAEWPETYTYLDQVEQRLGIAIIRLSTDATLEDLVRERGRWPALHVRYCTKTLKYLVLQDWLNHHGYHDALILFGQRWEESRRRAQLPFYDPPPLGPAATAVFRPVLDWTEAQVFAYLDQHDMPPNPVYNLGATRVSCAVCPLTSIGNIIAFARTHPDRFDHYMALEAETDTWKTTLSGYGSRREGTLRGIRERADLNDEDYVSTNEAAEVLGVSTRTVQRWARDGRFPNARQISPDTPGSPWLIPLADLEPASCDSGLCHL